MDGSQCDALTRLVDRGAWRRQVLHTLGLDTRCDGCGDSYCGSNDDGDLVCIPNPEG